MLWQFHEWVTSGWTLIGQEKPNPVTKQKRGRWACQMHLWVQGWASQKLQCLILPLPGGHGFPGKPGRCGEGDPLPNGFPPLLSTPAFHPLPEPCTSSSCLDTLALLDFPLSFCLHADSSFHSLIHSLISFSRWNNRAPKPRWL